MVVGAASSTPFIDWSLLGQIALISIAAGVGLVVAFSLGLASLSYSRKEEHRRFARFGAQVFTVVMGATIVGALIWGLALIVRKT